MFVKLPSGILLNILDVSQVVPHDGGRCPQHVILQNGAHVGTGDDTADYDVIREIIEVIADNEPLNLLSNRLTRVEEGGALLLVHLLQPELAEEAYSEIAESLDSMAIPCDITILKS